MPIGKASSKKSTSEMSDADNRNSNPKTNNFDNSVPALLASRRHTQRFILIICGIALVGLVQWHRSTPSPMASRIPLYLSIATLQVLFVWFVNKGIRANGRSLLDLFGRRWRSSFDACRDVILAVAFVVLLRGCTALLQHALGPSLAKAAFLLPVGPIESLLWVLVSIVSGVGEEIIFRGYLQRQLWALSTSLSLSIVLQAVIFATAHVYQGWRPAMITGFYGIAFGFLAAWRKTIVPGAIAHSIIDVIGGLFPR
jgi:membrane protease YdiL (CAAX protease family)